MPRLCRLVAIGTLVATTACAGGGVAPELGALEDQEVAVGDELVVQLIGTDADGDALFYSFDSDVPEIRDRASITTSPSGTGVFRWTPLAADVGTWFFDFTVSDGNHETTVTIQIAVKSAVGNNGAPVFRQPLGTGTTLDLEVDDCLEVDVLVEDQDSSSVVIAQEAPLIDGATLEETGGLTAVWRWCPSEAQIEAEDRYTLALSADDLSTKTTKNYLIVLLKELKPDCPGEPPIIQHTPMDESTLVGLTIPAQISDDAGLKREPLFYYSDTPPSDPPDLGSMTQETMVLLDGDMQSGTWAADVPNPVAGLPQGSTADLYYVIIASDDDDPDGDCDHRVQAPSSGAYSMTVTNPGGTGGAGVCEPCTADVQCGGTGDLCVRVGTAGDSYCLRSCTGDGDCPTDYTCSPSAVTSVDGASGRQCEPVSNDCSDPGGAVCMDDAMEDNDTLAEAAAAPPLAPDLYDLVSCPANVGDDEDFFEIDVSSDAQVTIDLLGSEDSDLDLKLLAADGSVIASSMSLTSEESVTACLEPGLYYIRVFAWGPVENNYLLDYQQTSMSCGPVCEDDAAEDDDNAAQARIIDFFPDPYVSQTNAICADDQDWYEVELFDGETVVVDLTFEQTASDEDLDLYVHDANGDVLTPCCDIDNGQSGTSNEHLEYTVMDTACETALCTFYVVVDGWNGSANLYDIEISLTLP